MSLLLIGLVLFIGSHSIRIYADNWRSAQINRFGSFTWKVGYSLVSFMGIVLIVAGYGIARQQPIVLWRPPAVMLYLTTLLVLVAFILIAATYVPRNHIKTQLRHPMVLGVQAWALGHLLANGTLAGVILFGSFLVWAWFSYRAARKRDTIDIALPAGTLAGSITSAVVGIILCAAFLLVLHTLLIGVPLL